MKYFRRYKNIDWETQNLKKLSKKHLRRCAMECSGMTKEELKDCNRSELIMTIGTDYC